MYEYKTAYRHDNRQIEGFKGIGSTEETAKSDCYKQITNKLEILNKPFLMGNVIKSFKGLNKNQQEEIKKDWNCNIRY